MDTHKLELNDRDLNVSNYCNEDKFSENVDKFIKGYIAILNRSGNTLVYSINNIFPLINENRLWGEGLYLFIDIIEKRDQSLPISRILKDIFLTNLHSHEKEYITNSGNNGLEILEGLRITGQDYLADKLLQMGQGKVVYNSIIKFLLAYQEWKKKEEIRHFVSEKEEIEDFHDEDLYYWLDVADGEATSDIPPSERGLYELGLWDFDEFKPIYENKDLVMNVLTKYIDLILEENSILLRKKMALTELYTTSMNSKNLNSNLIYGQLHLLLNQIKEGFSLRNIDLKYINETINNFYKSKDYRVFEICRISFNNSSKKIYVIFAEFKGDFLSSVFLKQLENQHSLFGFVQEHSTINIHKFIDLLLEEILKKHAIADIQSYFDEDGNQEIDTVAEAQETSNNPHMKVNLEPIIQEKDLPWF